MNSYHLYRIKTSFIVNRSLHWKLSSRSHFILPVFNKNAIFVSFVMRCVLNFCLVFLTCLYDIFRYLFP